MAPAVTPALSTTPSDPPARARAPSVRSTTLFCEVCAEETVHRVLRWRAAADGAVDGTARCGTCRWTHPFHESPAVAVAFWVVRSEGERSDRTRRSLPDAARLTVGEPIPGDEDDATIRKIETRAGRPVGEALARDIATVWTATGAGTIRVSLIDGAETLSTRWTPLPGAVVTVGVTLTLDGVPTFVVGFRGRGRTWRRSGDSLPAAEVSRIYARRMRNPPAGRSRWSSSRSMATVRVTSRSRSSRPRSSSGVR